jgi:predicted transcriptional regulator of viral defense system
LVRQEDKKIKTVKPWTFLTNHALVLLCVSKHHRITAREISLRVGITERAVRAIIADLEELGYIQRSREGREAIYSVDYDKPMRHPSQQKLTIGNFLKMLQIAYLVVFCGGQVSSLEMFASNFLC